MLLEGKTRARHRIDLRHRPGHRPGAGRRGRRVMLNGFGDAGEIAAFCAS